jgi:hypothetical protein
MAAWITFFALNGMLISGIIQVEIMGMNPPSTSMFWLGVLLGGICGAICYRVFGNRENG